eukprot:1908661-Prymnesium_polylepis.1
MAESGAVHGAVLTPGAVKSELAADTMLAADTKLAADAKLAAEPRTVGVKHEKHEKLPVAGYVWDGSGYQCHDPLL